MRKKLLLSLIVLTINFNSYGGNADSKTKSTLDLTKEEISADDQLRQAINSNNLAVAKKALSRGANVNAEYDGNYTYLHHASSNGYTDLADLIIKGRGRINIHDKFGQTPLHLAAYRGYKKIVKLLINANAHVDALTSGKNTPLHYAAHEGKSDTIEVLLEAGAKVNAQDKKGLTPLHHASSKGSIDSIKALLKAGAEIDIVDKTEKQRIPIDYASSKEAKEVLNFVAFVKNNKKENISDLIVTSIKNDTFKNLIGLFFIEYDNRSAIDMIANTMSTDKSLKTNLVKKLQTKDLSSKEKITQSLLDFERISTKKKMTMKSKK